MREITFPSTWEKPENAFATLPACTDKPFSKIGGRFTLRFFDPQNIGVWHYLWPNSVNFSSFRLRKVFFRRFGRRPNDGSGCLPPFKGGPWKKSNPPWHFFQKSTQKYKVPDFDPNYFLDIFFYALKTSFLNSMESIHIFSKKIHRKTQKFWLRYE